MILYFSGTGNSEYVAEELASRLEDSVLGLNELIKENDHREISSEKPWVIVAPTYAWQLPRIVRDWLYKAKLTGNRKAYFALTCGSGTGNAGTFAKRLCKDIGMEFMGLAAIVMPENYIAMFHAPEEEEARKIIKAAEPKVSILINRIGREEKLPRAGSPLGWVCSAIVNPLFYAAVIKDSAFRVSDACVDCGLCDSLCPTNNIRMENGHPTWHGSCTHCMACICHCPEKAIEYGRASVGKPRYTCPPM